MNLIDFSRYDRVRAVRFSEDCLELLDQRVLPHKTAFVECRTVAQVVESIKNLTVRGAPAIGIAAAYGVVLSAQLALKSTSEPEQRNTQILRDCEALHAARPTAVNLAWALQRMREHYDHLRFLRTDL